MKTKFWEFIGYFSLAGLIVGQITIGFNFWIGQLAYLIADVFILIRCFAVKQATSDKVKNISMTAICLGVIIIKIFCEAS